MFELKFVFHLINRSLIPILRLERSLNGNNLFAHGKLKPLTESAIPLISVTKVTNRRPAVFRVQIVNGIVFLTKITLEFLRLYDVTIPKNLFVFSVKWHVHVWFYQIITYIRVTAGQCMYRSTWVWSCVFFSDISTPLAAAYHGKLTATFSFTFLLLWTGSILHFTAVIVWIFSFFVLCDASQADSALVPNYNFIRRLLDVSRV